MSITYTAKANPWIFDNYCDFVYGSDAGAEITAGIKAGTASLFIANDADIIIISPAKFYKLSVLMGTPANTSITPTFQYLNRATGSWDTISVTDGTAGFTQDGDITWDESETPNWWNYGPPDGANRIVITRTEATVAQAPINVGITMHSRLVDQAVEIDRIVWQRLAGASFTAADHLKIFGIDSERIIDYYVPTADIATDQIDITNMTVPRMKIDTMDSGELLIYRKSPVRIAGRT